MGLHHDGAAAVIPVLPDGRILMVKQYRNALDRFTLEIPAGKLDDPKEEGIVCASRELEEETGYRCERLEPLLVLRTTVAFCNERREVFAARDLIPSRQHLDEDEFIELQACTLAELKEKIFSGEIQDSKTWRPSWPTRSIRRGIGKYTHFCQHIMQYPAGGGRRQKPREIFRTVPGRFPARIIYANTGSREYILSMGS